VGLSNWPAFLGKQNLAIAEFQTLIAQQEQGPAKPQYVSTYTILGNMHLQMGNKDKALAVWNQGLALFPNDAGLLQQIQSTSQQ
jgi:tetratricopeptide (TPR) repeat protein